MRRYLWLAGGLAAAALIAYGIYYMVGFFVVSSSPSNHGSAKYGQSITVTFNKALSPSAASTYVISPTIEGKAEVKGRTFTFTPSSSFDLAKTYTFVLRHPTSTSGQVGSDVTLVFTVRYADFSSLSKDQQHRLTGQTDQYQNQQPIVHYLPQTTGDYSIDYTVGQGSTITLKITTYAILNRPEQEAAYEAATKQYRQEALDYIKSKGFNPNSYPIEYTPVLSSDQSK